MRRNVAQKITSSCNLLWRRPVYNRKRSNSISFFIFFLLLHISCYAVRCDGHAYSAKNPKTPSHRVRITFRSSYLSPRAEHFYRAVASQPLSLPATGYKLRSRYKLYVESHCLSRSRQIIFKIHAHHPFPIERREFSAGQHCPLEKRLKI